MLIERRLKPCLLLLVLVMCSSVAADASFLSSTDNDSGEVAPLLRIQTRILSWVNGGKSDLGDADDDDNDINPYGNPIPSVHESTNTGGGGGGSGSGSGSGSTTTAAASTTKTSSTTTSTTATTPLLRSNMTTVSKSTSNTTSVPSNSTSNATNSSRPNIADYVDDDAALNDDVETDKSLSDYTNQTDASKSTSSGSDAAATATNATLLFLPPEQEQPDSWPVVVLGVFVVLALALCTVTAIRACRRRSKRNDYQEIQSLVV